MSTHQLSRPSDLTGVGRREPANRSTGWRGRSAVAALGLAGAVTLVAGVRLPWLSTFDHLLSQDGWGSPNGTRLVVLAAVSATLAVVQLVRPSSSLRWLLAVTGFVSAGFA